MVVRHVRRHWKKYLAGQVVGTFLISYISRKHRERNVIREYSNVAKAYGEEKTAMLGRPKKLMIFLNASANNLNARAQFNKYAAPLFYLSGVDVTVVESQYEGHIKMLMEYVDPATDGIVVAGGDATILEVLNGLRRRKDADSMKTIPVGILPLGKENNSFKTVFPSFQHQSPARMLGEASLKIILGLTKQIPVLEIQPEKGKTMCALSSVQWGVFKDAWRDRNRFRLFGKLRVIMSHLSKAARHWPEEGGCGHTVYLAPMSGDLRVRPASVHSDVDASMKWVEGSGWSKRAHEDLAGFKITPSTARHASLSLMLCPRAQLSKSMFINHGWCLTTHGGDAEACPVLGESVEAREVVMVPEFSGGWLSVDGEEYESLPMTIRLEPDSVTVFS